MRTARRVPLAWGDRAALRWTAVAFSALAALVLVSGVFASVLWWQLAGREGLGGAGRVVPSLAALVLGGLTSLCLYGLSRVCRTVTRLCDEPSSDTWRLPPTVAGRGLADLADRTTGPAAAVGHRS